MDPDLVETVDQHPRLAYSPQISPLPPVHHKVYILDCKSCDTFLTNRAMKAVLLLRPNIPLYSSDALPVNCSVYTPSHTARRADCKRSPTSHVPPRTCDCLTQTLSCHGCGSVVGYMIVIPCVRCTSSMASNHRATNSHRFVFHSSQIIATERRYIPEEPGVLPYETVAATPDAGTNINPFTRLPSMNYSEPLSHQAQDHTPRSTPSSSITSDHPPTSPPELVHSGFGSAAAHAPHIHRGRNYTISDPYRPFYVPASSPDHFIPHPYSRSSSQQALHFVNRSASVAPLVDSLVYLHSTFPLASQLEQKGSNLPRKLKAGDILFWHHLARTGEIPGIEDDKRARNNNVASIVVGPPKPAGTLGGFER